MKNNQKVTIVLILLIPLMVWAQDLDSDFLEALMLGKMATAKALLSKGAAPNAKNKNGITALMFAAMRGDTDMVKLLLVKGANPNAHTSDGRSAVDIAIANGEEQVIPILKEAGAKAARPDFIASAEAMWAAKGDVVAERKFIHDHRNQLTWLRPSLSPDTEPVLDWMKAKLYCEQLVFAGFDDWRLPTEREAQRLTKPVIEKIPSRRDDAFWTLTEITALRSKDNAAIFF